MRIVQEVDRVRTPAIVGASVLAVAVFVMGIIWSGALLVRKTGRLGSISASELPVQIGEPEVGMVNQRMFKEDFRVQGQRHNELLRLQSYGWIDVKRGIVHIPIERAMQLFLAQGARQ